MLLANYSLRLILLAPTAILCCAAQRLNGAENWRVGFAKVDVTPDEPLRLSGYASRVESHTGVADPLAARAMVISPADATDDSPMDDSLSLVLVSVDSIAVTSLMTVELSNWLNEKFSIPRSQLALCSTHSHAAPHVDGALNNLYREPLTPEQLAATRRYTAKMSQRIQRAIELAMANRKTASLSIGTTEAGFAINRRVLKDGTWTGIGEQVEGPVDHRVRLMVARNSDGDLLGAAFMYACHCTTLGGNFNQISGDWAGLTASRLEQLHAGSTFLPVIGCGADANPNPRGTYELAQRHAAELVSAIEAQISRREFQQLDSLPVAHFGYAGLAPEQPTSEYLQQMQSSERPNDRRWAEHMLSVKQEMGRLPETYPMPIHTWQFGDQLTWVFLGGEVVVDYQLQIEKELPTKATWVAAYTDDVFAYVASERMRTEGGYEVDSSMVFYLQPGRWQTGTQSLIVRRTAEILRETHAEDRPLSAAEALKSLRVPDGFRVDLVAAEPLVQDPINIAFGADGRVWIVEMADYPLGVDGGGRVKWLRDSNADGILDEGHLFLSGLAFPTSVMPWRNGVIVIAAPDIFLATDQDGDGAADHREILLTGIDEANPQHRASGFEIGLDGWWHFATGSGTKQLTSHRNGKTYDVQGRDVAWNPETGEIRTTSGETQFVRGRDAFGNWFGNSNSRPMYQYVIEDRYLDHMSISGGPRQDLLSPAVAPPVFPRSRTLDRFNDLYAFNRFTSACSSIVVRAPGLGANENPVALICEPVHNLVARIELLRDGSRFTARRHPDDAEFDFFTSTDAWSRPVRAINAPDGTIWILDMVRLVIEHPEWIPTAWQERLDVRGGSPLGRIYRVYRHDFQPTALVTVSENPTSILPALASENGAVRDLALQRVLESEYQGIQKDVRRIANEHATPEVRASALGCMAAKAWLRQEDVVAALQESDPRLVRLGLELAERFPEPTQELCEAMIAVVDRNLGGQVDLQWVLTATRLPSLDAAAGFLKIARRSRDDSWIATALSLIRDEQQALSTVEGLLELWDADQQLPPAVFSQAKQTLAKLWSNAPRQRRNALAITRLEALLKDPQAGLAPSQLLLMSVLAEAEAGNENEELGKLLFEVTVRSLRSLRSGEPSEQERLVMVNLFGCGLASQEEELQVARELLMQDRSVRVKQAVVETLRRLQSPKVASLLLHLWPELDSSLRASVGATLLARREWTVGLITALESGKVGLNELDLATLQQLRTNRDREIRNRCVDLFGKPTQRSKVVAQYLTELPAPSKTPRGEKLYREHCAACHQQLEGKPMLGPPLENLAHWTLDQWITAILDPNQAAEPKYRQSILMTSDGQIIAGIVLDKGEHELQIAASDGSVKSVAASDIESEKEAGISLMPEGFEQKLSPQELSELLGFLRSR